MFVLLSHVDYIEYEPTRKHKIAEEINKADFGKKRMENALIVYIASEKTDEKSPELIARKTVEEIKKITEQIKVNNIVLLPYVHITPTELSSYDVALNIIKRIEELLKGYNVSRAPFGWSIKRELRTAGHPMSDISRRIS